MDVYLPPAQPGKTLRPAVFFVHGGPVPREMSLATEWGVYISYGELAVASGLAAVVFNHRLRTLTDYPVAQSDMKDAIEYVRRHGADLGIDAQRIGVWVFSGGGPLAAWCLRERPPFLRCLVAFYALLDVRHTLPADADAELVARAHAFSPGAHLGAKSAGLPIFVARAGLDTPFVNESIDRFVREAMASNAPLDLVNHAQGQHGFDVVDDVARSREIIAHAFAFVNAHLSAAI